MTEREASREKFEAYHGDFAPGQTARKGDGYEWLEVQLAWLSWQAAWKASRQQAMEEAAQAVDALRDDAKEEEVAAQWKAADVAGLSDSEKLARASFWSTVSTLNDVFRVAAKAIRSLTTTGDKA